jgi:hypothetical protein
MKNIEAGDRINKKAQIAAWILLAALITFWMLVLG